MITFLYTEIYVYTYSLNFTFMCTSSASYVSSLRLFLPEILDLFGEVLEEVKESSSAAPRRREVKIRLAPRLSAIS